MRADLLSLFDSMPKKFFRRFMPDHDLIRNHKFLNRIFGTLLHDPNLLHLNRRSVSGAVAVGLFLAFVPLPIQMLLAAGAAILLRVNLPIAVGMVWLTNPFTMTPLFFFSYKVGTWILGAPLHPVAFELSWAWLGTELVTIWQPFLLGCFVVGSGAALLGWLTVRILWRLHIIRYLKLRALRHRRHHKVKADSE